MANSTNTHFDVLTLRSFTRTANVLSSASEAVQSQYSHSGQVKKFADLCHSELSGEQLDRFLFDNYFNTSTATGVGLDSLADRVGVERYAVLEDGTKYKMTDEELRTLIVFKALANIGDATIDSIQKGLIILFGDDVKVVDNGDMTLTVFVNSPLSTVQLWILKYYGLVQRGGGVGYRIVGTYEPIFGFNGQKLSTFNVGVFYYEI